MFKQVLRVKEDVMELIGSVLYNAVAFSIPYKNVLVPAQNMASWMLVVDTAQLTKFHFASCQKPVWVSQNSALKEHWKHCVLNGCQTMVSYTHSIYTCDHLFHQVSCPNHKLTNKMKNCKMAPPRMDWPNRGCSWVPDPSCECTRPFPMKPANIICAVTSLLYSHFWFLALPASSSFLLTQSLGDRGGSSCNTVPSTQVGNLDWVPVSLMSQWRSTNCRHVQVKPANRSSHILCVFFSFL